MDSVTLDKHVQREWSWNLVALRYSEQQKELPVRCQRTTALLLKSLGPYWLCGWWTRATVRSLPSWQVMWEEILRRQKGKSLGLCPFWSRSWMDPKSQEEEDSKGESQSSDAWGSLCATDTPSDLWPSGGPLCLWTNETRCLLFSGHLFLRIKKFLWNFADKELSIPVGCYSRMWVSECIPHLPMPWYSAWNMPR